MEKRKFFSDLLFVQGINILVKTAWILIIDRAVQNLLPSGYGTYYRLLSLSILFVIFLDLGLNNMNSKSVAQDTRYFYSNFKRFLSTKFVLGLAYIVLVFSAAFVLGANRLEFQLLGVLAGFQIINSFNLYLRSNLAALHLFKLDGLLAVADRFFVIVVCSLWIYVPEYQHMLTVKNFALVQLSGVSITLLIALVSNLTRLNKTNGGSGSSVNMLQLIKASLPYALLIALMAIFTRVDAVMVGQFLGDLETDRYAMSYRLLDAANMMAALFSGMLLPMFARKLGQKEDVLELTSVASKVLIVPAVLIALILSPHAHAVLALMYPNKLALLAPNTFILLMFSFVASASVFVFGTLLTAADEMRTLNILALVAAVGNIILNLILIPSYGVDGAAFATLITQSGFAVGCIATSYRKFDVSFTLKKFTTTVLVLAAFVGIYFSSKQFFDNQLVHISFGILISVLLVVGSGIINPSVLKKLSRRKTQ
ncbi:MAG: polysaccharide biosynthesis C-terminal domain-containing protein [Bacteroidia bacterium]|nr:polysaccharide biosynthesis C-terminal domain-containing protein [Bacteroidia bacterium]